MKSPVVLTAFILTFAAATAADYRAGNATELAALNAKLQPGDTVALADGEWRDQAVAFRAHGAAGNPITLRAATAGKVVLAGKSTLVIEGDWLVVSGVIVREGDGPAQGIAIKGTHNRLTESAMIGGTYKHFLRMWGAESRVDHCYFEGKTSGEPTFQVEVDAVTPNNHRIDHNHFGPRPPLGRNGGETMRIGYSGQSMWASRTVVEQNLFDRCDGEIEIISSKSCENIYRQNTFLDCDGMLTLRHGNRCLIDSNFFIGHHKKGSRGIRVIGEDHVITNNYFEGLENGAVWFTSGVPHSQLVQYFQARRTVVAFNTVVDCRGPVMDLDAGIGGAGRLMRPAEITVANNLFILPAGSTLFKGTEGEYWNWAGNLVSGAPTDHAGVRTADLKLARAADGRWRPASDSPAHGAAEGKFPTVKADIDGQPRGEKADAGCDQISDAPVTNRPLTKADVGPAWRTR